MNKKRFTGFMLLILLLTGSLATTVFAKSTDSTNPQTYKTAKTYIHYRSKPVQDNTNYFITSKLPLTAAGVKVKSSNPEVAVVKVMGKSSNGKYYRFGIVSRKEGKAELRISAKVGKKDILIVIKTTIVNYKNPVSSLKIGDRDYRSRFSTEEKIDKDIIRAGNVKISCQTRNGWSLDEIKMKKVRKEDGTVITGRLKNNSVIAVEQGGELELDFKMYNPSLDKYTSVGVQLTGKISKPQEQVYNKIIMVGDSRTYRTYHQFGITAPNVSFIAKSGQGYVWMATTAASRLRNELLKTEGKTAVVFNLGVNDLWNIDFYLSFMNTEMLELSKSSGADFYYMSVNPVSEEKYSRNGYNMRNRNMSQIRQFNAKLKSGLDSGYQYIDTFSYLMKYYDTEKLTLPDGLHYTQKGSQIIFDLFQAYLANHKFQYEL